MIDPNDDFGFGGVINWMIGLTVAALVASAVLSLVVARLGRHRFGGASIALSIALIAAVAVVAVVVTRIWHGEATRYDTLWAVACAALATLAAQRLLRRPDSSRVSPSPATPRHSSR